MQAALLAHRGRGRDFWSRSEISSATSRGVARLDPAWHGGAHGRRGHAGYGNQKQLELGIALASDPQRPAARRTHRRHVGGGDARNHALLQRIAAERGLTLLFTEHDMAVVFGIAEKIAVLYQGRKLAEGTPDEVRAEPRSAPRLSRRARLNSLLCRSRTSDTAYGLSQVLFGISLDVAAGRMRLPCSDATGSANRPPCARSWG